MCGFRTPEDFRGDFLTGEEARVLEAICERLLPGGETPGAREAGVVHFIDHMLSRHYAAARETYRTGLSSLEQLCRQHYGRSFPELGEAEQDTVLEALELSGVLSWPGAAGFFETVRAHTIEGFFSDPSYGGNRGGVGWHSLR